jgi:pimeloyl-[acyl-carrier protein] methyl ester esterase
MTVHVEVRGAGPDVVLLHGWGLHGGVWGRWLDGLARVARLHIVDLPGHGCSPWPAGVATIEALAAHLSPSVPARSLLLGWSLGGMVALEMARQRAADPAGLILICTTPRFVTGTGWPHAIAESLLRDLGERLRTDHARTVRDFLALQTLGDEHQHETLRDLRAALGARPPPAPDGLACGIEILRHADLRTAAAGIVTPALVIAGERDRLTPPEAAAALARMLPAASFRLIRRAAHAPFLSHAAEVLGAVEHFVTAQPPAAVTRQANA